VASDNKNPRKYVDGCDISEDEEIDRGTSGKVEGKQGSRKTMDTFDS